MASGKFARPRQRKPRWPLVLSGFLLLTVLGAGLLVYALKPLGGRIGEGVSVNGLSLAGLTRKEAEQLLQEQCRTLVLSFPGTTVQLTSQETGLELDTKALLKQAMNPAANGPTALSLRGCISLEERAVRRALEGAAAELANTSIPTAHTLAGTIPALSEAEFDPGAPLPTLAVTAPVSGLTLDVDRAWSQIQSACALGQLEIDLGTAVEAARPLAPEVGEILEAVNIQPVDARMDLQSGTAVPGSYGLEFDREELEALLSQAGPGETVRLEPTLTSPQVLGKEVYFQDVLGFCQTPHGTGEQRNTNLRLACQALNGVVLEPGETLSYNATLGQRTLEAGYQAAPAYSGTDLVNTPGGGVCQVSSTLYLCSLYAGLETVERVSHGYPSSYMPIGLDATVSWGSPDLKIRNNGPYPVKIVAENQQDDVRVWIMGTETRDYYVRMGFRCGGEGYARNYIVKYDRQTGACLGQEEGHLSSYLADSYSAQGEIGSDEVYQNGNTKKIQPAQPSQDTLEASMNYQKPNTRG